MKWCKQVLWLFLVSGIVLTFSSTAFAIPEEAAAETAFTLGNLFPAQVMPDSITVFGFGKSRGIPDGAVVNFGLTTCAPSAQDAQKTYRELLDAITAALAREGVPRDDISPLYFNISPDYGYAYGGLETEVLGCRLNSTISVRLTDLSRVSQVLDAAFGAGANWMEGIRYFTSRADQLKQEALLVAIRDARAQAELIARALGRKVGRVLAVDQSIAPPYELQENVFTTPQLGLQPDSLVVTQYVRVVFQLD